MGRLVAGVLFLLAWVVFAANAQASKPPDERLECELTASLLGLHDSENKVYVEACAGPGITKAEDRVQLRLALERLLRLGDWRATLAMSQLGQRGVDSPRDIAQLEQHLQKLLEQPRDDAKKCPALHDEIANFHAKRIRSTSAFVSLDGLEQKPCNGLVTGLDAARSYAVVAYLGAASDELRAYYLDDTHPTLVQTAVPLKSADQPEVQLLLVPKNQRLLIAVTQPEFDVAWTTIDMFLDDAWLSERRPLAEGASPSACLNVEVAFDDSKRSDTRPILIIDGQVRSWDKITTNNATKASASKASLVLDLIEGQHEIVIVPRRAGDTPSSPVRHDLLIERQINLTLGEQRCHALSFDVTGLDKNNRYGLAGVVVDKTCEAKGITRAGVRDHVEAELERHGKDVKALDVLADSVQSFFELQAQLEAPGVKPVGGEKGKLADGQRLGQIAAEIARQGIDQLLTLELHCSDVDDTVTLTGTKIDLFTYSRRVKDSALGVDLSDVIRSQSSSVPRSALRHAFDRVLGEFLQVGFIRVTRGKTPKLRDTHTQVSVVLEAASRHTGDLVFTVEVFRSSSASRSRQQTDLCASVGPYNSLNPGAELPPSGTPLLRRERIYIPDEYQVTAQSISKLPKSVPRGRKINESVDLGGLPAGTWLIVASMNSGARELRSVTCIEIRESSRELWVQLDAGRRIRGRYFNDSEYDGVRAGARQDQINYLQALGGVRFDLFNFGRYGGELGYGVTQYTSDTPASWDGLAELDVNTSYIWTRHSLLLGGAIGAELPMSGCDLRAARRRMKDRALGICKPANSVVDLFVDFHGAFDFGFVNLSQLPKSVRERPLLFDLDIDVGLQSGLRFAVSPSSRIGFFAGVWFTDLDTAVRARARPELLAGFDYDYAVRWVLGAELAIGIKHR